MVKGYFRHSADSTEDITLAGLAADIDIQLVTESGTDMDYTDFFPACQGMIYQGEDPTFWGMDICTLATVVMTETGVQIQFQE